MSALLCLLDLKAHSSFISLSGTKAAKAQSWSIPIVNHTWLEDCFIQWRNLTVGLEKYIGFPTGVDFSKLLGVRGVGGAVDVEGLDAEVDAEGGEAPHGTDASVKEVQGLIASEDVDMVDEREEVPVPVMDDGGDEDEQTTMKKALTSKPEVNRTSPLSVPTSSRISPEKLVAEHDNLESDKEELKTTGKRKRKPKNWVSSPENEEESTRIQKQKEANKKTPASDDESEMEMLPPKIKVNSKGKEKQVQPLSGKTGARGDDNEVEAVSSKIAKTNLNAKGRGKEKVSTPPKESKKDDEEDEDEDEDEVGKELEASKKNTHSKNKIKVQSRSTKPKSKTRGQDDDAIEEDEEEVDGEENPKSNGVVELGKKRKVVDDDNEDDKVEGLESEDELSLPVIPLTPPPRAKSTKLIRRVSQVVVPDADVGVHSQEEWDKEQQKEKPRLSLVEKSQAEKRDARTRVRKRKAEVVEAEVDEDEQEEPAIIVKSSSTRRKTTAKTLFTFASVKVKGKEKPRVHNSDSEEEEEAVHKPEPQKTTKKSVRESKPAVKSRTKTKTKTRLESYSDDDDDAEEEAEPVQELSDSNSDLPAAPVLSLMNGKKDKRVTGGSTPKTILKRKPVVSISAPAAKSTKSKARGRGTVESEDDDGDDVRGAAVASTPKRAVSVLMPSFNLSANKKGGSSGGVKEVEKSRNRKKAKLSVSSEEDDENHDEEELVSPRTRAITRTESIRVMSNHHVSTKYPSGAVSGSVKKNTSAVASSSKSKLKSKPAQMDIDGSPSPPFRATKTLRKSDTKSSPTTKALLKRSAATKATQRLHDTIMPDVVQFESQMKRSRKSGGMSAFKVEGERKRGQTGDENEDGEERVKKRRRVDDDDDDDDVAGSISVNAKGKGKRKVPEEEEEEEEEDLNSS